MSLKIRGLQIGFTLLARPLPAGRKSGSASGSIPAAAVWANSFVPSSFAVLDSDTDSDADSDL
jgi:hypothetical protein